jgi:hypothetical protein
MGNMGIHLLVINILLVVGLLLYNFVYQRFLLKRRTKLGHYRDSTNKIKELLNGKK